MNKPKPKPNQEKRDDKEVSEILENFFNQSHEEFMKSISKEDELPPKYRNMFLTLHKKP